MGQRLVYDDTYITCENASFIIRSNETNNVLDTLHISQNADGIDIEDRIIKLKKYIKNLSQ